MSEGALGVLLLVVSAVGLLRVLLRGGSTAHDQVGADIEAREFQWDAPRRRKWWQRKK